MIFITGITGQCGSILVDMYLKQGEEVLGLVRRSSTHQLKERKGLTIVEGDLTDYSSLHHILNRYSPYYIINCAAQSHVHTSFKEPLHTIDVTGKGVLNLLEVMRCCTPNARMIQFSSSEMFGDQYSGEYNLPTQDERTLMNPQSPYAIAKLMAYHSVRLYRSYNLFTSNGIFFNMESERRGENFVTRKITKYVVQPDINKPLRLGNLDTYRDWSYVPDSMEATQLILEHDKPDDFVVGTGKTHTVKEFLIEAFKYVGIDNWQDFVVQDERFMRPSEVPYLCAKTTKIKNTLGWTSKTTFKDLVHIMIDHDANNITR